MEYRFHGITIHSLEYIEDLDLLSLGTSKGEILNYKLKVGSS